MIRNFKNLEEYNVFTNNGQNLVSGDLYWIDDVGCYFLTNNIDGELKKYDALDEIPPEYIIPTGNVEITANGENINVHDYATASVNVPIPEGYVLPTGDKTITENGQEIDVYDYATATVNVQPNLTTKAITENGTYAPQNADGFSSVTVNVPIPPEYIIPTGNKEITSNGTNINVHDYATASVNVQPDLTTQTITENGTYTPQNHDGFSSVTVNVASGGGSQDLIDLIERDITTLNIPDSVTSIGERAFQGCTALTSVTIPNGVTSISNSAFQSCTALTSVTIPNSVTTIGSYAFSQSGLTSVTIENGVTSTSIGQYAFKDCTSLTSVTIPDSVTSIGQGAFNRCTSLTSVTIENGVTSIGGNAFKDCTSLTSVTIPNSVTSIGEGAFNRCTSLTSVTIENGVTSIGGAAFENCISLTSVTIPNNVTTIGNGAFAGCTALTNVTIENGVTSIGGAAFRDCTSLTSVTVEATTPPTLSNANAFGNTNNCPIYVPAESVEAYKAATNWSSYADRIQAIPTT